MFHAPRPTPLVRSRTAGEFPAEFGGITTSALLEPEAEPDTEPDYVAVAESREFAELRSTFLRFVLPVSAMFLAWYLGYVVLAAWFPRFMSIPVAGAVNVGLLLGLAQFVVTLVITALYVRFAAEHLDPRTEEIRRGAAGGELS